MTTRNWNFDPAHSEIAFKVRHMMFSKVSGSFDSWEGEFQFDPDDPTASTTRVEIEAASIDTGNEERDGHLVSEDFLDTETYPTLTFQSTDVEATGDGELQLTGDLTIRGTTKSVTLDVDYHGKAVDPWGNDRVGFTATTEIDRKDFDITWNQTLDAGGVLVGDTVEIELNVQAVADDE